jgi:hypothetical protein
MMLSASPSTGTFELHPADAASYAHQQHHLLAAAAAAARQPLAQRANASVAASPRSGSGMAASHQLHPHGGALLQTPARQNSLPLGVHGGMPAHGSLGSLPSSPVTFGQLAMPGQQQQQTQRGQPSVFLSASPHRSMGGSPSSDSGSPQSMVKQESGTGSGSGSGGAANAFRGMPERSDSMASFADSSLELPSPGSTPGHGPAAGSSSSAAAAMAPPPVPSSAALPASGSGDDLRPSTKFVHKLFRMVSDPEYQHLISWNGTGSSVVVTNFDEFSKEVLGKHFKHSNFSSFIRQLNM